MCPDKYSVSLSTRSISMCSLCLSSRYYSESVGTGAETATKRVHSAHHTHGRSILTHPSAAGRGLTVKSPLYSYSIHIQCPTPLRNQVQDVLKRTGIILSISHKESRSTIHCLSFLYVRTRILGLKPAFNFWDIKHFFFFKHYNLEKC